MRHPIFAMAAAAAVLAAAGASAQDGAKGGVPDFSGYWQKGGYYASTFEPPDSGPGPVVDPKPHPTGGIPWVGDYTNPILKPKAAAAVKATGDHILAGKEDLPAYSLCWPSGVPQVLNLREPVEFLQTPTEITILYQRDHQVRRVYLNVPHSKTVTPSWYGESVGHYEGSDTLVVDTIGVSDKSDADKFGTPHSDQIHIIERYHLVNGGKGLRVDFTVEDPVMFNMAWSAKANYTRTRGPVEEIICAENNKDATTGKDYPVPIAAKPDF
jgi:hypothetical protein